jgi:2-polyprenyl-6-methoxyphenol hydroxylase-like FAD-dependent oxidoreductase
MVDAVEVVVAGGGPAGLAAAVELGSRGVSVLVLEPRTEVSMDRPRAKTTSVRTMEHLRRWGLADRLREVAPLPVAWSQDTMFATSVLGREITRFHNCLGLTPDRCDEYAEAGQQVPQPLVEQVLREALAAYPNVRFATGWSMTGLTQDDNCVTVEAIDADGVTHHIKANYVLGCDGASSVTRHAIGARFDGSTDGRPNFSMVFRSSKLAELVPHKPAIHHWVLDPSVPGLAGRMNLHDTWWAMAMGVSADAGNADPIRLIRALIGPGGEDVDIEMVSTDPWTARMLNANTYRVGRVFLVGDAAHLNPPWGGHGFNTAVGDAVNVGWKLAAMLQGWGGPSLLDSYEPERKPIAQQTIDLATRNMSNLSTNFADPLLNADGPEGDACRTQVAAAIQATKHAEFHSLGLVLGYHYGTSTITVADDSTEPETETSTYTPSSRPGSRLPHLWLPDGRSIYDVFGTDFTLLVVDPTSSTAAIQDAAERAGVPMTVVDLVSLGCASSHASNLYQATMLLIRPDQHVAWRTTSSAPQPDEAEHVIAVATGRTA